MYESSDHLLALLPHGAPEGGVPLPVPGLGVRPVVQQVTHTVQLTRPRRTNQSRLSPSVRLGVGHEGEHDVLDDLEHVWLDQLPRVGVRHDGVDVVEGLLHHAGAHIQLPLVRVQVLEHGGEVPLLNVLRYHTENSLYSFDTLPGLLYLQRYRPCN